MRFLKDSDYSLLIRDTDFSVIVPSAVVLENAEFAAIQKVRTKLIQRYDMDYELRKMGNYNAATNYRAGERVIQDLPEKIFSIKDFLQWDESTQYYTNDVVTDSNGYIYKALQASKGVALTSSSYWVAVVNEAPTDAPNSTLYSTSTTYQVGDYAHNAQGVIYECIQIALNKPLTNMAYWTPVAITLNDTYWNELDNRYTLLVYMVMDIVIYNLHAAINPRNIPELRADRYLDAIEQLTRWASGDDNAEMKELANVTTSGLSIIYGNAGIKTNNMF